MPMVPFFGGVQDQGVSSSQSFVSVMIPRRSQASVQRACRLRERAGGPHRHGMGTIRNG